jgi:hypothetical protein
MSLGCLDDGTVGIVLGEVCAYMRAVQGSEVCGSCSTVIDPFVCSFAFASAFADSCVR